MSAHTPGPWVVDVDDPIHGADTVRNAFGQFVAATRPSRFARDNSPNPSYNTADARLIAAAPDLYEALKAFLAIPTNRSMQDEGPSGEGWQSDELELALTLADAALAKAEGKV